MQAIRILLGAALALQALPVPAGELPLTIAVSIPPQKYLAERIGGERLDVRVMLSPGRAPETFEPTPRQIASLAGAKVYFRIGVPFENAWLASLGDGNPEMIVVDCCAQFGLNAHEHDHGGDRDPHVWVSPLAALQIAELMQVELAKLDPEGAPFYAANMRRLADELLALHGEIEESLAKRRTSHFVISHDSLGQFAATYGLTQLSLEAGGKAAGPRSIGRIMDVARAERICCVLVQREFNSAAAATLAQELNAEIIEIDPLAGDFIEALRDLATKVALVTTR